MQELLDCVQSAGAVRPDVTTEDLGLLFRQLRAIQLDDEQRALTLRRRYLELALQALHAAAAAPLPGPPPAWDELRAFRQAAGRLTDTPRGRCADRFDVPGGVWMAGTPPLVAKSLPLVPMGLSSHGVGQVHAPSGGSD